MKKIIILALIAALCCAACGTERSSEAQETKETLVVELREKSEKKKESEKPEEDKSPESELYFKDDILRTKKFEIEIADCEILYPGEEGNEHGDKPVIAFWYNTTNLSGDPDLTASSAWIMSFRAIQDNNPDIINELNVAALPDDAFRDTQSAKIKPGGMIECAVAYELSDLTTPVTLKGYDNIFMDPVGVQTFDIAQLTGYDSPSQSKPEVQAEKPTEQKQEKPVESKPEKPVESGCYFKDGVLQNKKLRIEITDHKVIQPGSEGNLYGDVPVLALWVNITNLTDSPNVDSLSCISYLRAIQDNDPNVINELDVGSLPDRAFLDTQTENIKPGGTVQYAIAFELSDLTTPVTLQGYDNMFMDPIGTQIIDITQ